MTKNELIAAIAEKTGRAKSDVVAVMAAQTQITIATLKSGDSIVTDTGKLSAVKREARTARNPSTGATIDVPAKTVVKFKASKSLSDAVA